MEDLEEFTMQYERLLAFTPFIKDVSAIAKKRFSIEHGDNGLPVSETDPDVNFRAI